MTICYIFFYLVPLEKDVYIAGKSFGRELRRRYMIMEYDEDFKSLCKALKAILDKRMERGEIEIKRDSKGRRVIVIR